jgi:hypothetical protein
MGVLNILHYKVINQWLRNSENPSDPADGATSP